MLVYFPVRCNLLSVDPFLSCFFTESVVITDRLCESIRDSGPLSCNVLTCLSDLVLPILLYA